MSIRGSCVHNSMVIFFFFFGGGHPKNVNSMQFSQNTDDFRQTDSTLHVYIINKTQMLENIFIFIIFQNYTLAYPVTLSINKTILALVGCRAILPPLSNNKSSSISYLCGEKKME